MRHAIVLLILFSSPFTFTFPSASAQEDKDPLRQAASLAERRKFAEAIAKAMPVAASAAETPERRGKAFDAVAQAYLEMDCAELAIATWDQALVALGRDNPAAIDAWGHIADVHMTRRDLQKAIAVLEKAADELDLAKAPAAARAKILGTLASCREQTGQVLAAIEALETLASLAKGPSEAAGPLARAARLYAGLQRFDKARDCLDRVYGKLDSDTAVAEAAKAYNELAQKLAAVGRGDEADTVDRKIITLFARRDPGTARAACQRLLGGLDDAGALKLAGGLADTELRALCSDDVLDALVSAALRRGRTDELARLCTRAMLADLFDETTAYTFSKALVQMRAREGRPDDALAAAAACYAVTGFGNYVSSSQFGRAIDLVADALRSRDGHLVSGNQFRLYQVQGPNGPDGRAGTADDLSNPRAGVAAKPAPELDRLFEAAIAAQPPSVAGHRARGWICLLWGKTKRALGELRQEFALCSLDPTELSRAAQDVALGLKALHGTPAGMDTFARFQQYGPNGPDGKAGTADDLKDPLAGL